MTRYERLRCQGKCGLCATPSPTRSVCDRCADRIYTRRQKMAKEHPKKGLCIWCTQPKEADSRHCAGCREKSKSYHKDQIARWKEDGRCSRCGTEPASTPLFLGEKCRKYDAKHGKNYYANNKTKLKEYRDKNKDKISAYHKEYYLKNKEKLMAQNKANYEKRKAK